MGKVKAEEVLIYLASCSINNIIPENRELIDSISLDKLLEVSIFHQMTAIAAYALQKAGYHDKRFLEERMKSVSSSVQYRVERTRILAELEKGRIWYMPLKGIILKDLYPQTGLRQMCDNDILVDADRADEVRKIMEANGYRVNIYDLEHRDDYSKEPYLHFEMHRMLFDEKTKPEVFFHYYRDVKNRLIKDDDNRSGFHFSEEDFYIYMIAHDYKHYSWGGTGLRSLLDIYVYLKKMGAKMNSAYIEEETEKLGIKEFEETTRALAEKMFSSGSTDPLSEEERKMLVYLLDSGAYGISEHIIKNGVKEKGKLRYILNRVFPPMHSVKRYYPFFYQHKVLLLFLPVYRFLKRFPGAIKEIQLVLSYKAE